MPAAAVFIDTSGWLALGYRQDPIHEPASRLYRELRGQGASVFTSDYVLDELVTVLFAGEFTNETLRFVKGVLFAATGGYLHVERITPEHILATLKLRYHLDIPLASLTDLTTMVVMQQRGIKQILTRDLIFIKAGLDFELLP